MMTKEELAVFLDGREYGSEVSPRDAKAIRESGLIVIFGASDDLVELRGAIKDEIGAYNGTTFKIDRKGLLPSFEQAVEQGEDDCEDYFDRKPNAQSVEAIWSDNEGYCWTFKTDIPHAEFSILEDGEKYCRGIVVDMVDLK